ncbi:MAG: HlyD family secretion protein [Sphingobium sp.]|jgi:membrane fusion protein (multidrug efflux system)|nr:HlyD family secretion protein [Sphingobium sp.]MCI1271424.1 HlyD family secretion protein [Sphingobium sp.]MCI1755641.1 HlyD family secretion protein [Sphingobium sp.]MCI2052537.1 HlyD family secretion protein [Sphingobium sp.]
MAEADPVLKQKGSSVTDFPAPVPPAETGAAREGKGRRLVLMLAVPLALALAGLVYWMFTRGTASTDNATINQDIVSVSSDVSGRIVEVAVHENQQVKAGDLLFRVDPEPYRVALAQADAAIAAAQVNVGELSTRYSGTAADITKARSDIAFAQSEYDRQRQLAAQGFTTRARLDAAQHDLEVAQSDLRNAEADAAEARSALATGGQVPGVNPQLAAARAQRAKAALDLKRASVYAPVAGKVSNVDRLQIGQMLVTGLPVVSIVANSRSWVIANFKETQLDKIRVGQKAEVTLDAYGNVKLQGHVASIGGGTGSEFSVLPAQNGNGNWVKVTQRVPVRIAIDQPSPRPLIAGLSADVTVYVDD